MIACNNVKEMEKVMDRGSQNRSVGATLMNADSSRSHSIFTIFIETCEKGEDGEEHIRAGKLNLVDLAGSERQAKTGATGILYFLTLYVPTPQNGQTHSNNSSSNCQRID